MRKPFSFFTVTLACLALMMTTASWGQTQGGKQKNAASAKADGNVFKQASETPGLPRVLLIGDSISIGYTLDVRAALAGKANVQRIPENGGPTSRGIAEIDKWLGKDKWDVIHFNWGLHDIKRMKQGTGDGEVKWQVSPEDYKKNLELLVKRLESTGAKLIWASTTPVPDGTKDRVPDDEVKANKIAAKIMRKHHIPTDDLYSHVLPRLAEFQKPKNVHFTDEGSKFLAEKVVAEINTALAKKDKK